MAPSSSKINKNEGNESKVIETASRCRGPGPAKYLLPGTVGQKSHDITKTQSPAFSFGQRHRAFSSSFSPGPKYMIPSHVTHRGKDASNVCSLYSRTPEKTPAETPGPGSCTSVFRNRKLKLAGSQYILRSFFVIGLRNGLYQWLEICAHRH